MMVTLGSPGYVRRLCQNEEENVFSAWRQERKKLLVPEASVAVFQESGGVIKTGQGRWTDGC